MRHAITAGLREDVQDAALGLLMDLGLEGSAEDDRTPGLITFYFPAGADLDAVRDALTGLSPTSIHFELVPDQDWNAAWRASFTRFPIATRFLVVPSWDADPVPPDRIPIYIDPGQAFGTGTHETTQLVIEAMEGHVTPLSRVVDVGTGSGILAIAARHLGAGVVSGCDVDPLAIEIARTNVERNGCGRVDLSVGELDTSNGPTVDLLLANLTADQVLRHLADFHTTLRPGGVAILSGILDHQGGEVLAAARQAGFGVPETRQKGEWVAIVVRRESIQ